MPLASAVDYVEVISTPSPHSASGSTDYSDISINPSSLRHAALKLAEHQRLQHLPPSNRQFRLSGGPNSLHTNVARPNDCVEDFHNETNTVKGMSNGGFKLNGVKDMHNIVRMTVNNSQGSYNCQNAFGTVIMQHNNRSVSNLNRSRQPNCNANASAVNSFTCNSLSRNQKSVNHTVFNRSPTAAVQRYVFLNSNSNARSSSHITSAVGDSGYAILDPTFTGFPQNSDTVQSISCPRVSRDYCNYNNNVGDGFLPHTLPTGEVVLAREDTTSTFI